MSIKRILIANRGEIAIRIINAASELNIETVAVYAKDDNRCLHVKMADQAIELTKFGPAAYLDQGALISIAQRYECDAIHPGYGFLSEQAGFAQICADNNINFIGPSASVLKMLGNKATAKELAESCNVPVAKGSSHCVTLEQADDFLNSLEPGQAMVIKAVAGGGGRGMRVVKSKDDLAQAYKRCQSEALQAFGVSDVYVEQFINEARHIEVQVISDGKHVSHLYERECSLQRRHQKIIEIAPAPLLPQSTRTKLFESAVILAKKVKYTNIGTFEFLVFGEQQDQFIFIEANPRLQVEHTITEELTGVDLVKLQIQIANGLSLPSELMSDSSQKPPMGYAMQMRINGEVFNDSGELLPASGRINHFDVVLGPGTRLDTCAYSGYEPSVRYDSLLAKLICSTKTGDFSECLNRAYRNLCALNISGIDTNIELIKNILLHPMVREQRFYTRFIDEHLHQLYKVQAHPDLFFDNNITETLTEDNESSNQKPKDGAIQASLQGVVVAIDVAPNQIVTKDATLVVIEAMKMEHLIKAPIGGKVDRILVTNGESVSVGQVLIEFIPDRFKRKKESNVNDVDLDFIRYDLKELLDRQEILLDEMRPDAVEKRHKLGFRTARENVADLCKHGDFIEYGGLAIAGQRQRKSLQHLIDRTPADGLVAGVGHVNGDLFDKQNSQCVIMSYDYTVLAGTQGVQNHRKKDRLFELAERKHLPVILLAEGGGGRPGDTDALSPAWLDCLAFALFAKLSGVVPLIGLANGRCFAGNAALFGCCDITVATQHSNIGMGGPAMIEGGGLGRYAPEQVGPIDDQSVNGVVDVVVENEAQGVAVCKKLLAFFQGKLGSWECEDQRLLRHIVPENRRRVYDIHQVIHVLADKGSVQEIRADYAQGMVTVFARIEGETVGILVNNPGYLSGAINAEGAGKAARFLTLCDNFGIPVLFLCDTPGFMVGPDIEKTGLVRHAANLFIQGAKLKVPFATVVLRKCYGLGAMAMAGGHLKAPLLTVSWPTGEFGAMGLEGAVSLGYSKELAAISDTKERATKYQQMVDEAYQKGKALEMATYFEFDNVIDPKDTRHWVVQVLF